MFQAGGNWCLQSELYRIKQNLVDCNGYAYGNDF